MTPPRIQLGPRFHEALDWAVDLHAGQARKGGGDVPYAAHLLAVTSLVLEDGGDEEDAVIALCHDTVEDQGGEATLDEVRRRFGDEVAYAVALLSDSRGEPKAPWIDRKATLLAQLSGPDVPERVLRVAAADKLDNARNILRHVLSEGGWVWGRYSARPAELLWFYRAVADVLSERRPGSINVIELHRVLDELASLAAERQVSRPA